MCHGHFPAFLTALTVIQRFSWQNIPLRLQKLPGGSGAGEESPVSCLSKTEGDFQT
jgi:hypothetical protein